MPALLIRQHVRDVETWRRVLDEEAGIRRANGSRGEHHFRSAEDASEVWLLLEWDDLFRAELFVRSDDLRAALARSGVVGQPDYWYLDDIAPDTS